MCRQRAESKATLGRLAVLSRCSKWLGFKGKENDLPLNAVWKCGGFCSLCQRCCGFFTSPAAGPCAGALVASPRAVQHHERCLKHCTVRLASSLLAFSPWDRPETLGKFLLWPPLPIGPPNAGCYVSLLAQPEVCTTVKTLLQISTPAPPFYIRTSLLDWPDW